MGCVGKEGPGGEGEREDVRWGGDGLGVGEEGGTDGMG